MEIKTKQVTWLYFSQKCKGVEKMHAWDKCSRYKSKPPFRK